MTPEIMALEDRRYAAMRAGDVAALRELLADDLVYTHSFGERDSKASYLDKVANGIFRYGEIRRSEEKVLIHGDSATVVGRMAADVHVADTLRRLDNRFLAIWVKIDGRWQFLAYQPTPMPAGS